MGRLVWCEGESPRRIPVHDKVDGRIAKVTNAVVDNNRLALPVVLQVANLGSSATTFPTGSRNSRYALRKYRLGHRSSRASSARRPLRRSLAVRMPPPPHVDLRHLYCVGLNALKQCFENPCRSSWLRPRSATLVWRFLTSSAKSAYFYPLPR